MFELKFGQVFSELFRGVIKLKNANVILLSFLNEILYFDLILKKLDHILKYKVMK